MLHIWLEAIVAILTLLPIGALILAHRRSPSRRLAFALAAFVALEIHALTIVLIHTLITVDHRSEEIISFTGDLVVILMFAFAFLWGSGIFRPNLPDPAAVISANG